MLVGLLEEEVPRRALALASFFALALPTLFWAVVGFFGVVFLTLWRLLFLPCSLFSFCLLEIISSEFIYRRRWMCDGMHGV